MTTAPDPASALSTSVARRAVTVLGDILGRMHGHASKKRDMLRRLESWSL